MALVAGSFVAIIAMAALSIDVGALYQAKAEAQRSADAAALAGARIISISGITGDPANGATDGSWGDICGGATSPASLAASNAAQQNLISRCYGADRKSVLRSGKYARDQRGLPEPRDRTSA